MANGEQGGSERFKHFKIDGMFFDRREFTPRSQVISKAPRSIDRREHVDKLKSQLNQAFEAFNSHRDPDVYEGVKGTYITFETAEGELLPQNIESSRDKRKLGAVTTVDGEDKPKYRGVAFVEDSKAEILQYKIENYTMDTPAGKPRNKALIEPLENIIAATLEDFWTDVRPIPEGLGAYWWECWCWKEQFSNLCSAAQKLELTFWNQNQYAEFPEFILVPVKATRQEITRLIASCDAIAELRNAQDTPYTFTQDVADEESAWTDELGDRVKVNGDNPPYICILDSGVNRGHPLLSNILDAPDCKAVNSAWGVDDHEYHGHGTQMAGLCGYGNLLPHLLGTHQIEIRHRLESVKVLPPAGFPATDPNQYGAVIQSAIATSELEETERVRIFCHSPSNEDIEGIRPSVWSGALDQACSGTMPGDDEEEAPKRLIIAATGNIQPQDMPYPSNLTMEDPAQSWNSITVGGVTFLDEINEPLYSSWNTIAEAGEKSPYSRTSEELGVRTTPIKPEIVFEAGNVAYDSSTGDCADALEDLSLLSTGKSHLTKPLDIFYATSAATAQAAEFTAKLTAEYPDLWPETIRALTVQSAQWTPAMKTKLDNERTFGGKVQYLREFGYGIPNLESAINSVQNDVTIVSQNEITPFKKTSSGIAINEAHFYELPWPKEVLESLENKKVRMKVTLSYFIEPSPGGFGWNRPERYRSCGLRFDMKRPGESLSTFYKRVNDKDNPTREKLTSPSDDNWFFGTKKLFNAGSLHCNVWEGDAAELAACGHLVVHPVGGWWKERRSLKKYENCVRYALIVSIASDDTDIDFAVEVRQKIDAVIQAQADVLV